MTVRLGRSRYRVSFRRVTACRIEVIETGGRMVCIVEGRAKCRPEDEDHYDDGTVMFDVEAGERIALRAALSNTYIGVYFDKAARAAFWNEFCYRWRIKDRPKISRAKATAALPAPAAPPPTQAMADDDQPF